MGRQERGTRKKERKTEGTRKKERRNKKEVEDKRERMIGRKGRSGKEINGTQGNKSDETTYV